MSTKAGIKGSTWVWLGISLAGVLALVYALRAVLSPVLFAFLLAYILDPVIDRLEERRIPRALAIGVLLLAALLALVLLSLLVLPAVARDAAELARELPKAVARLLESLEPLLAQAGIELPGSGREALAALEGNLRTIAPSALGPVKFALGAIVGGTANAVGALAGAVMLPILTFYLLHDFDHIVARMHELLPLRLRAPVAAMAREVDEVLGQFVRGQLTVMLILAVLYALGYGLLGVPLAVPIGLCAGLLAFIPYVGGAVALGLALLMVALHFEGWGQVAGVVVAYGLIQVLEGFVITPRIVGEKLGLPPLWVLFALMVGGDLFGFVGVMLALPASAVIKVFVMHGLTRYRRSPLFLGESALAGVAPRAPSRLRLRTGRPPRRRSRRLR